MKNRIAHRRGVALIMVLIVIVLLSLGAYSFTDLMVAQQSAAIMSGRRVQAQAAVASGVEFIKDYLALDAATQESMGGHYDNSAYFQDVVVASEPEGTTQFSIISIVEDDYGGPVGIRFGLQDEASKININQVATSDAYEQKNASEGGSQEPSQGAPGGGGGAGGGGAGGGGAGGGDAGGGDAGGGRGDPPAEEPPEESPPEESEPESTDAEDETDSRQEALMVLPGMTQDIADAILDWIDEDSDPRPMGAELEYYGFLGYEPRNGPIDSLDELLLVRGMSPELLYGADRNHNGVVDDSEQGMATTMQGAGFGSMDRGWSAFLTVTSKDLPSQDLPVDLNQDDLEAMFDEIAAVFDEDTATFIAAYRQNGAYTPEPPPEGDEGEEPEEPPPIEQVGGRTVDLTKEGSKKFTSVLDLIGALTRTQFEGGDEQVVVESPFNDDPASMASYLPDLMANLTAGETGGDGRINIHQGCQTVLSSVPTMTDTLATSILGQRDPTGLSTDPNYQYATWPLAFGVATVEEMKALMPFVSVSGGIFRAHVVGYSDMPGAFARAEVVIDATGDTPRVVSWRDLTHLGPGYPLDMMTR